MRRRVWADLALGARLALAGGGRARLRTALTALGVGLGVALLLGATSIPEVLAAHEERTAARDHERYENVPPRAAEDTLLATSVNTAFRDVSVRGVVFEAEGPLAPAPPGLRSLPAPGTMVVSPALAELLASDDGKRLLAPRLPYDVAGTIADAGLAGPQELTYYAGSSDLGGVPAMRIDAFGSQAPADPLGPILTLVLVVIVVALLLPVAIFLAAAVRFGGEQRDRRLAALRLVGADAGMARRIAAGEALAGAGLGLALGTVLFVALRPVAERVEIFDVGVFAGDLRPSTLPLLAVLVAIPGIAVGASLLALRTVTIDPLGVVRQARPRRRRLWWRLALPVAGGALMLPLLGVDVDAGESFDEIQVATGVTLLLVGVAALLPWLVETAVHRLGGGGVAWQLAVRRLQLDSGTSARVVSGIAVAVAGAITLQTLFKGVDEQFTANTGERPGTAYASTQSRAVDVDRVEAALRGAEGVQAVTAQAGFALRTERLGRVELYSATCASVRALLRVGDCADGDAFAVGRAQRLRAGDPARVGQHPWVLPAAPRAAKRRSGPPVMQVSGLIATPGYLAGVGASPQFVSAFVVYDRERPDAIEGVRNAFASLSPLGRVDDAAATVTDRNLLIIRRGLFAGAVAVLLLIAASMLVSALEQMHERRRLLAALVAFGTPRSTISRSVLLQTAVPVGLGLLLAIVTGAGLGALLLDLVNAPVRVDVPTILGLTAIGAAVVPLVTALSLPALRRLMRPEGLRFE